MFSSLKTLWNLYFAIGPEESLLLSRTIPNESKSKVVKNELIAPSFVSVVMARVINHPRHSERPHSANNTNVSSLIFYMSVRLAVV